MKRFMLAKDGSVLILSGEGLPPPRSDPNCKPPRKWKGSEKFDGYRAQYFPDEDIFLSRALKPFNAPDWFKLAMPDHNLDGELWIGRENFESTAVVRRKNPVPEQWIPVKFIVYDIPTLEEPFYKRLEKLEEIVNGAQKRWNKIKKDLPKQFQIDCPLEMAKQVTITSEEHMKEFYLEIIQNGGEGIMIKDPNSFYEDKRSNYMLKVKPTFDEEAIIVDYKLGKGKYTGILGGFICKPLLNMDTYHLIDNDENHEFSISGMDDKIRNNYKHSHPIGTIITFEHSGKTDGGKPRFARYIRKRDDIVIKDNVQEENNSVVKIDTIISILQKIANYEKANREPFKANSYVKVISGFKKLNNDSELTEINIKNINGVGDSIYQKIRLIIDTGTCPFYEKIKNDIDPRDEFLKVHAIVPLVQVKRMN